VELLTGTVTFLFSDIEGSTLLLRALGKERYGEIRDEHERLLGKAFQEHGGRVVDTQGDSLFCAFESAFEALAGAVEGQRALREHAWPEGVELRVRIGIHTGEPVLEGGRYVGLAVHHGARLSAAGHGGQILVSEATRRLVEEGQQWLKFKDLGPQRLRDLPGRERVFQVEAPGLLRDFPPLRTPERGRRRRMVLVGAAAAAVLAAVLVPLLTLRGGGAIIAPPNSVAVIDPASNRVVAAVPVGQRPTAIAAGEGAVWVVNDGDHTVSRIDSKSRTVVRTIAIPGTAPLGGIAAGEGAVWLVTGYQTLSLVRIGPGYDAVEWTHALGQVWMPWQPTPVAVGAGAVWTAAAPDGTLARIDPRTGTVSRHIDVGTDPAGIAVGEGAVWVAGGRENVVVRVDPGSNGVLSRPSVGAWPTAVAAGEGAVWVAANGDDAVSRVDPQSASVVTIPVGKEPVSIAVGAGSVWVANSHDGTVSRIDPQSRPLAATIRVGASADAVAASASKGAVWVAVSGK
jgi:YVTN family beta-propeller protein